VPLVAPMLGAAIAAPVYWLLVEAHHPPPPTSESKASGNIQKLPVRSSS